mgnify:CR=1 FL=1
MGDIKRKRKMFVRPKKLYDKARIDSENGLVREFGLKNKREVWKANLKVSTMRRHAKELIGADMEKQQVFFTKLNKMGLTTTSVADVLALTQKDLLARRLQTFVFKLGLGNSVKQARQLVTHKHVLVNGQIVNSPSFWVSTELEKKIELKIIEKKEKEKPVVEEAPEEATETTETPEETTKEVIE